MRRRARPLDARPLLGLEILHEDGEILVVDKPPGLLTIATDAERTRTAYAALTRHVRTRAPASRIFIVHRLDRETSGVMVFAKTEGAKHALQGRWEETQKTYHVIVHGRPAERSGVLASRLVETAAYRVVATRDPRRGRPARTAYRVLKVTRKYAFLEVEPETGRKHQIRVHLADAGMPVVGDRRYGVRGDVHTRMALHAASLAFPHPGTGARVSFAAPLPPHFHRIIRGLDRLDPNPRRLFGRRLPE